jgi:hypothetical protein
MTKYDQFEMMIEDLKDTNPIYNENVNFWRFLMASYEGIRSLVKNGFVLYRHERESENNFERRVAEAYSFGYSSSIVDLFNFYLFKRHPLRDLNPLNNDKQWKQFENDCNLYGDDWLVWLLESQRWSGVMGHCGVLVDKSSQNFQTSDEELNAGVYPYVARYFPQNILDWEYKKDENNRPYLAYLKLLDNDGQYRIWTTEYWSVYIIPDDESGNEATVVDIDTGEIRGGGGGQTTQNKEQMITSIASGPNPFIDPNTGRGEIPFVWFYNIKSKQRPIGISDIKDVAYIDGAIIRNLSEGEEVISYGAFPMMRKPMVEAGQSVGNDLAGITGILEFDPTMPESKPDWLESKVSQPIDAILRWIELKVNEIYRTSNVGGLAATEIQSQARSGAALKSEFQLLNGKLVSKGANAEEAEKQIIRYWLMWQNKQDLFDKIMIEWPESYDIEDLAQDLENTLTAKTIILSKTFSAQIQKKLARSMLKSADIKTLEEIDNEIDEATSSQDIEYDSIPDNNTIAEGDMTGNVVPVPVSTRNTEAPVMDNGIEESEMIE